MAQLLQRTNSVGKTEWFRPAFDPADYEVPRWAIQSIESWRGGYQNITDLLSEHDGPFGDYSVAERFDRGGKQWVVLQHGTNGFALQIEETKLDFGEVIPVDPRRAYELACLADGKGDRKVIHE